MEKVDILDLGLGNLRSLENALSYLGARPRLVREPRLSGDKVVLPGVGSFAAGVKGLEPFVRELRKKLDSGTPLLGICLGMHLLFEKSEESKGVKGLALLEGEVRKLKGRVRVPHMGWSRISVVRRDCPLLQGLDGSYFYFVHSYRVQTVRELVAARVRYGGSLPAVVWRGKIFGTQFHPERSGEAGLKLLQNFLEL